MRKGGNFKKKYMIMEKCGITGKSITLTSCYGLTATKKTVDDLVKAGHNATFEVDSSYNPFRK